MENRPIFIGPQRFDLIGGDAFITPPIDYVLRKKIKHSTLMLRSGRHTVTGVPMHLGFSTSQSFATVFRRYHGFPAIYRPDAHTVSPTRRVDGT